MNKIFISYSRQNESFARRIYRSLCDQGADVWLDLMDIPAGADWSDAIHQALVECNVMLLIISKDSMASENVADEWKYFFRKKLIVPIKLEDADMHFQLNRLQYIDFLRNDYEVALQQLWRELQRNGITFSASEANQRIARITKGAYPPDLSTILPGPFKWCEIPSGNVVIEYGEGRGEQTFWVDEFYIAKYPVSNSQYEVFLQDENGYGNTDWWDYSAAATAWRRNHTKLEFMRLPNMEQHPRVNLTSFEAIAFCRWLTEKTDYHISLPTEQQWQRSGQGNDRRKFPWGMKFDKRLCNTLESGNSFTTPVTKYPSGASPFGVMDLSGNVWEWCLISDNYQSEPILAGGTWGRDASFAQLTYRRMVSKELLDGVGFRIACSNSKIAFSV